MDEKVSDQMGKAILLILIALLLVKFFQDKIQELGMELVINNSINISLVLLGGLLFGLSLIQKIKETNVYAFLRWMSLFIIFLPLLNISYYSIIEYNYSLEIIRAIIMFSSYTLVFSAMVYTYHKIKHEIKHKKEEKDDFERSLNHFELEKIHSFENLEETQTLLERLINSKPKLAPAYNDKITKIKQTLDEIRQNLIMQEDKLKENLRQAKRRATIEANQKQHEEYLTNQILKYFRLKGNTKTIPETATKINHRIIEEAKNVYRAEKAEQKWKKEKKEEAIKFIQKYQAYPSDFENLGEEEKQIYKEIFDEFKKGKLAKIKFGDSENGGDPLLDDGFYHAKDLSGKEREKLIREYDYRSISFVFLETGKKGNNLIINNDSRKESDYHYCIKYLVHEIDKEHSTVEFFEDEQRADVVFKINKRTLAVEIETGKNKDLQVEKKIDWLNKKFSQWIIICSRKNKKKYNKHTDNKKSFCLTMTEANKKIRDWLSATPNG